MAKRSSFFKRLSMLAMTLIMSAHSGVSAAIECQDSSIGQELHLPVYCWSDKTVPSKGLIVAIHGATLYAKRFDYVARHFAAEGYSVYAMDMRGFGSWRTDWDRFGGDSKIHYTQSQNDVLEVLAMIKRVYPEEPVYLLGESLGANLAVWVASVRPDLVNGIVLSSPCVKRVFHPGPRVVVDFAKGLWHPFKELSLEPHIKPYLSDDPRVTDEYLKDPVIYRNLSPADLIKSVKTNRLSLLLTSKIPSQLPILVIAGKKDKIYKASAIPAFVSKINSQKKTVHIVEDKGHLLLEHAFVDPRVLGYIDTWLRENDNDDKIVRAPD